jgi:SAM-dependent methyltransferase
MIPKEVDKILRVSNYAKDPTKSYGGSKFYSGYHDLNLRGVLYKGQRSNSVRLSKVNFDFKNKVVLDIGCNVGGVLHELAPLIQYGVGIDNDSKYVNTANLIRDYNHTNNINFYVFDLDKQNLSSIQDFVLLDKVDVCFFLSMAKWVKKWVEVVKFCSSICDTILFETNGSDQERQEQIVRKIYSNVSLVYDKSMDDVSQHKRRLLLGRNSYGK